MIELTVIFVNNSNNAGTACLYQNLLTDCLSDALPLAWLTHYTNPGVQCQFNWNTCYSFAWAETNALCPGVVFFPGQDISADLSSTNYITLTKNQGYEFTEQIAHSPSGILSIYQDGTIPASKASVGIGVSGKPVYAVQAQPNMLSEFTPVLSYYITFGNYSQGEALSIQDIFSFQIIEFPDNITSMTVTLSSDNTWSIATTLSLLRKVADG